ncbi:MAG: hypothetical protein WDN06_21310 [Asticcacaulis sp.]
MPTRLNALMDDILSLRAAVVADGLEMIGRFQESAGRADLSLENLARYLQFRHHDLRVM